MGSFYFYFFFLITIACDAIDINANRRCVPITKATRGRITMSQAAAAATALLLAVYTEVTAP